MLISCASSPWIVGCPTPSSTSPLLPFHLLGISLALLLGLLLGLALLLARVSGGGLLQNLENLLVLNLLVRLVLLQVQGRGRTQLGDAVLGDGNGGEVSGNLGVVLVANQLVLTEDVTADTLDDARLGITLILKLSQAEGESSELLLDLGEDLARGRSLEAVGLVGTAVEGGSLVDTLDLARTQTDTNLDTPDLADLGGTVALGALGGGEDNLLASLNLVAVKQPRGGALDEVHIVGLGDLLQKAGDLGLGRGLLGGSLGLLLIGSLGQEARGDHESQEQLIDVVVGQDQIGGAASDGLSGLVLGGSDDSVANDGAEAIDLGTELDLDGLSLLDLDTGLSLVGGKGSIGSDVGRGGDRGGVGEALVDLLASVDLGNLLLDQLITLLANVDNLGAGDDQL